MREETHPSVSVRIGDRELVLRYNARALRLIKESVGFDILTKKYRGENVENEQIFGIIADASNFAKFLWATSQNDANGPTAADRPSLDWVEEYLDLGNLSEVMKQLAAAVTSEAEKVPEATIEPGKP